jgi:hypothetical protein
MQAIRDVAGALGATQAEAARLAETYWTELYPNQRDEYHTAACYDGGPLERDPASRVWPY